MNSENIKIYEENDGFCKKTKTEYYYFFRIDSIIKAKETYQECNSLMLNNKKIKLFLKEARVYDEYKKLYDDFIVTADKLIDGSEVHSKIIFKKYIYQLMIIANNTIDLTQSFLFNHSKKISQLPKLTFKNKKTTVKKILNHNLNVPCYINPDDISIVATNKFVRIIMDSIAFILLFVILLDVDFNYDNTFYFHFKIACTVLSSLLLLIYLILLLLLSKTFNLLEIKNKTYSRNCKLVFHPFNQKISCNSFLSLFNNVIRIIGNLLTK